MEMKQKRLNINRLHGRGTSTFVQLPDDDCLRARKTRRCTLPPSLIAEQFNFHLQLQMLAHFLISITNTSGANTISSYAYTYDPNGNTIQRNVNGVIQNFVYDVDNRLIEVRDDANNLIATYTYDPFGRRIRKIVSPSGGGSGAETTWYLYSDEGLIGEYDNSGNQIRIYGYKPNSTWSTDPLFMREGGNIYFYHNDHLGTPQKMTNISGQTVWQASYDAFGKATIDEASTITNNLRFPGQYYDAETGWHYNWNRYYDPNTGRYITADPKYTNIVDDNENFDNTYLYSNNDPINKYDPFGLFVYIDYLIDNNYDYTSLITKVQKGYGMTSDMPKDLVMTGLECMSKCLKTTITISSGWRTKKQNANTKGAAKASMHLLGYAADVHTPPSKTKIRKAAAECGFYVLRKNYPSWVHVDTRGARTTKINPDECICKEIREGN
jgi:RHS repeat-associated protein